jgi:hypothetical protein
MSFLSSSPPIHNDLTTPLELEQLVLDATMADLLNHIFVDTNDLVGAAHLRHFQYIALTIHQLEQAMERHIQERRDIFDHLMANDDLRHTLRPVVRTFRQRCRRSHPSYHRRPNLSQSSSSSSDTSGTYYSPRTSPPASPSGSPQNPINVDDIPDVIIPLPRLPQIATPTCTRCRQTGHIRMNCDTRMRSFTHCEICDWRTGEQNNCNHYDISPVDFQRLRGNIPYDNSD